MESPTRRLQANWGSSRRRW